MNVTRLLFLLLLVIVAAWASLRPRDTPGTSPTEVEPDGTRGSSTSRLVPEGGPHLEGRLPGEERESVVGEPVEENRHAESGPASPSSEVDWKTRFQEQYSGCSEAALKKAKEAVSQAFQDGLNEEARKLLDMGMYVELEPGTSLRFEDVPTATPPYENQFICRFGVKDEAGTTVQRVVFLDPVTLPGELLELGQESAFLAMRVHELEQSE